MRVAFVLGLVGLCLLAPPGVGKSFADDATTDEDAPAIGTVTIMSGSTFDGTATIARDLATLVGGDGSLRVVPIVGQGPAQTMRDVLSLGTTDTGLSVDMGVTHSTVLYHYARTGELGPIKDRLVYVAKLFNEDLHLLTGADIAAVQDLSGKTVNVGRKDSGTAIAARILFEALGIDVQAAHLDAADAVEKLKAGEIDATILIGTTPIAGLSHIKPHAGLQLLPVPYPPGLEGDTYPAILTHDDYPALIPSGTRVDTIGICAVLVALSEAENTDRQANLQQFVDRFFSTFDALQRAPNHPKWSEVNFAATLEEWPRARQAQVWIDTARSAALAEVRERENFKKFLSQTGDAVSTDSISEANQENLFRAFKAWSEAQDSAQESN